MVNQDPRDQPVYLDPLVKMESKGDEDVLVIMDLRESLEPKVLG